jgi:hypothetical protein
MTRSRLFSLGLLAAGLGAASIAVLAVAPLPAHAADSVRPEVGKPLQAAQDLASKGNFDKALDEIAKADVVGNKTPHETLLIEEMRGSVAERAGKPAIAIKAFEAVVASGTVEGVNLQHMEQALAALYNEQKDYPKTIQWLLRYRKDGGADPAMHNLLIQVYFDSKDFVSAEKELLEEIAVEEKGGQAAPEVQYQLLMNCYLGQNDTAGYVGVLQKAVMHYPKPDYWADLVHRASTKPGFASTRLSLDLYRLRLALGVLKNGDDYRDMTQLALEEHLPGEAKDAIEKGFSSGAVGKDDKLAVRDGKLRELATKSATDDQAMLDGKADAAVAAKNGEAMLDLGFDYVSYGQFDKGLKLMETGLQTGTLKHPDDAKLHLGVAYLRAGQKPKAIDALKKVGGTDGTADLAQLWILMSSAKAAS